MGIWNNDLLPKINCKEYDSESYKLQAPITVSHLDDWTREDPTLVGSVRDLGGGVKEQDAKIYIVSPANASTPNAQLYNNNGKKIYYTAKEHTLTFKKTIVAGNMIEDPNADFFTIGLKGEMPQFIAAGITHIQDPLNIQGVAPWGYYGADLHGSGKFEIFELGTTTPFKLPLHLDLGAMDGGGISRDAGTKGTHIGEKFKVDINGTFSNTKFDSFKKCAYGGQSFCYDGEYAYLKTKVAQTTALYQHLSQSIPPTIDGKSSFTYEPRISQTLNGTDEGDGLHGGDGEINSDFTASTIEFNYWTNTSGVAWLKLLSTHEDPDVAPVKIEECEQRINIHEGIKDCESCDCTNKVDTYVFRKIFKYKDDDSSETKTPWLWKDRNLIAVECDYMFNGDTVINLHEQFPFILDYSRRRDLENVDICLHTCSDCNNCDDTNLTTELTVQTSKLKRCPVKSACEDNSPVYNSCGKDISCKDCWSVDTKLKYDTSKMCGIKQPHSKKDCLLCIKKMKQYVANLDSNEIGHWLRDVKMRDLTTCSGQTFREFGDKKIIELINEVNNKLKQKQNKSCMLSYISMYKSSDF